VGAEAACNVTVDRKTSAGKALLEANEIIFRGDFRLVIPLEQITAIDATDGKLAVTYADGTAVFDLGPRAEKWAAKIRNPKSVIDKLDVEAGQRAVLLHVRDEGFADRLRERGAAVSTRAARDADVIFVGAETLGELAGLRQLVAQIKRDGAIWTITPKGKGGIKDTDVMGVAKAAGLVALKVVSFSDTHSANKF
jgi:hypothetical protein